MKRKPKMKLKATRGPQLKAPSKKVTPYLQWLARRLNKEDFVVGIHEHCLRVLTRVNHDVLSHAPDDLVEAADASDGWDELVFLYGAMRKHILDRYSPHFQRAFEMALKREPLRAADFATPFMLSKRVEAHQEAAAPANHCDG